jgi:hypothetical protein
MGIMDPSIDVAGGPKLEKQAARQVDSSNGRART